MPRPPRPLLYKAKLHFLTWPQAPQMLTKEHLMGEIRLKNANKFQVTECFIARETHEDGHPHFHAVVKTDRRVNVYSDTWDIGFDGDSIHGNYQACKSVKDACEYLMKEDDNVMCYGPFHITDVIKARKSKTSKACAAALREGKITSEWLAEHPEMLMQLDKVKRNLEIAADIKAAEEITVPAPTSWYPYQEFLLRVLSRGPHARRVYWFTDPVGNLGKSFMCRYLGHHMDAITLGSGSSRDLLYGYRGQPIVLFDFTREKQDCMNYSVIEQIKNGHFYNTKYEAGSRMYKIPHIICFANWDPDFEKMSQDRWKLYTLDSFSEVNGRPSHPDFGDASFDF